MTTFRITAIAPTTYQLRSVRAFGSPVASLGNGSHIFQMDFDTREDAEAYLEKRADYYWEADGFTEEEREEAVSDIKKYGMLTIDAVTGRIDEVESEVEEEN